MFFIIGLGIGAGSEAKNKAIACNIGGVYSRVEDNDAVGLRKAVSSYYQYLAMGAMLNEVRLGRLTPAPGRRAGAKSGCSRRCATPSSACVASSSA